MNNLSCYDPQKDRKRNYNLQETEINYYMSTPIFKDFKCFNYKLLLALD